MEVRSFLTTTVSGKNEDELVPAFGSSARDELSSKAVASIIESDEEDEAQSEEEKKNNTDAAADALKLSSKKEKRKSTLISSKKEEMRKSVAGVDDDDERLLQDFLFFLSLKSGFLFSFSEAMSSVGFGPVKQNRNRASSSAKQPEAEHQEHDDGPETAVMLYDYDGKQYGSIPLSRGAVVVVLKKADGWWWCATKDGRTGYLPADFLHTD